MSVHSFISCLARCSVREGHPDSLSASKITLKDNKLGSTSKIDNADDPISNRRLKVQISTVYLILSPTLSPTSTAVRLLVMPPYPKQPVADSLNPCYCPSVPARAYIHNLHQDLTSSRAPALSRKSANNPFARLLAQCLSTPSAEQHDKGVLGSESDTSLTSTSSGTNTTVSSNSSSLSSSSSFASGSGSREEQFHSVSGRPCASNPGNKNIELLWSDAATLGTNAVASNITTNGIEATVTLDSSHVDNLLLGRFNGLRDSRLLARSPRKRKLLHNNTAANGDDSDPDSDLQGPPKQMRSIEGSPQRSFEVLLKRETLEFDKFPSSREEGKEGRLSFGPAQDQNLTQREAVARSSDSFSGFLSPRPHITVFPTANASAPQAVLRTKEQFMESIKQVAPMIRIPDSIKDPQALARYLGRNGLLTTALMCVLAVSNVQELLLGPSLQDYNGLNIGPPDLFRELHRYGTFKNLVRLSCDNVSLKDDSMVYLHCLPLQDLSLSGTNLTNAAIFLLIPLKRTLAHFSIGRNPAINDDAIPALIMLKNLKLLILEGTHVDMGGLRRFAGSIHSENRKLRIEIPLQCQHYLGHMHHHYLLHPVPPLLNRHDRDDIWNLQLVELRKNLAAHSAVNRAISTTGNKTEMRLRLSDVLMKRERDLMVKRMYEDGLIMIVGGHIIDGRLSFGVVEDEIDEESDVNDG